VRPADTRIILLECAFELPVSTSPRHRLAKPCAPTVHFVCDSGASLLRADLSPHISLPATRAANAPALPCPPVRLSRSFSCLLVVAWPPGVVLHVHTDSDEIRPSSLSPGESSESRRDFRVYRSVPHAKALAYLGKFTALKEPSRISSIRSSTMRW